VYEFSSSVLLRRELRATDDAESIPDKDLRSTLTAELLSRLRLRSAKFGYGGFEFVLEAVHFLRFFSRDCSIRPQFIHHLYIFGSLLHQAGILHLIVLIEDLSDGMIHLQILDQVQDTILFGSHRREFSILFSVSPGAVFSERAQDERPRGYRDGRTYQYGDKIHFASPSDERVKCPGQRPVR
jgi:hypothetical protein